MTHQVLIIRRLVLGSLTLLKSLLGSGQGSKDSDSRKSSEDDDEAENWPPWLTPSPEEADEDEADQDTQKKDSLPQGNDDINMVDTSGPVDRIAVVASSASGLWKAFITYSLPILACLVGSVINNSL